MRVAFLFLFSIFSLLGCDSAIKPGPHPSEPRFGVVSQSPALTEILCRLGGGGRLLAVSQHTSFPPEINALPRLSVLPINIEALNDLEPDLVLAQNPSGDLLQYCEARGVLLENFRIESWNEVIAANERMARIFSLSAEAETQRLRAFSDARSKRERKKSAVLVISRSPGELANIMTASRGFLSESLELAGLKNAFADQDRPYPLLNLEAVLDRKPDWIIELRGSDPDSAEAEQLLRDWKPTQDGALKDSRVRVIALSGALIPGPRITELVEALEAATREPLMLRAESISVCYPRSAEAVLKAITLELRAGQLVVLIGPNGAAKSTLLRALAGVLPISSGTIQIQDQALESLTRLRLARRLAYCPQQSLVPFAFTGFEVAAMGRYVHGDERLESGTTAVIEALRSVDAEGFGPRDYNELSGGEKQRVSLARSLAQACPILLLDEPTSAQDLEHKLLIFEELRRRCDAGLAASVATHDLNIAAAFADLIMTLHKGREYARGTAKEMLSAEILREVFSVEAWFGETPSQLPFAIPLRRRNEGS